MAALASSLLTPSSRWRRMPKDGSADMTSSDADFIAAAYRVLLCREADPAGTDHYTKFLADKPSDAQREEMLLVLLKSPEFTKKALDLHSRNSNAEHTGNAAEDSNT